MPNVPPFLPPDLLQKAHDLNLDWTQVEELFIHGHGAGGQKINKTSSCVQLVYSPLGIVIKCQKHREREKNRLSAHKLLISKVENIVKGQESAEAKWIFKLRKQKQKRSKRAKEKVLEAKRRQAEIKQTRRAVSSLPS